VSPCVVSRPFTALPENESGGVETNLSRFHRITTMTYEVEYRDASGCLHRTTLDVENDSVAVDKARLYFGATAVVLESL
jgi:hypothetical protein